MKNKILRLLIEMGFILFLFYANLLMGEYTRSHLLVKQNFMQALQDIFSTQNFIIAVISAFIGYVVFEYLRKTV
jgi:hypothetical protein